MAIAEMGPAPGDVAMPLAPIQSDERQRALHRIRTVRQQQGVSLRSAARALGFDMRRVRRQQEETADISLSDLYRWQQALDVPVAELLEEPEASLSKPVMERARLVRLMKTAAAIQERAESPQIRRMAEMLVSQLTEIMPELKDVGPWHSVGQRRSLDEYGRVVERRISDDAFTGASYRDDD